MHYYWIYVSLKTICSVIKQRTIRPVWGFRGLHKSAVKGKLLIHTAVLHSLVTHKQNISVRFSCYNQHFYL